MKQKPRRVFIDEQKVEVVHIVNQSGRPVSQGSQEMGLTELWQAQQPKVPSANGSDKTRLITNQIQRFN
jgi:hypothetical protein